MGQGTMASLGEVIRQAREAKGLSIRQLAPLVGADHSLLARVEKGRVLRPSPELVQRIAHVLDIDAGELLALIGITPSLPDPAVYFQTVFGVNAEQAHAMMALLIQHFSDLIPAQYHTADHGEA